MANLATTPAPLHRPYLSAIPQAPPAAAYAMSQAQLGNFLMYHFLKKPGPFNSWIAEQLPFLEADAAWNAAYALLERHEILRTTLEWGPDGQPCQRIHPASHFQQAIQIEKSDLPYEACLENLVKEARAHFFNFEKGPLFYVKIVELPAGAIFLMNLHHVLTDAWSNNLIRKELMLLYQAQLQGKPSPLPPLPIQFKDYAHWHRQMLTEDVREAFRHYWHRYMPQPFPQNDLSLVFAKNPDPSSSYRESLRRQIRAELKPMAPEQEDLFFGVIGKIEMHESAAYRFVIPKALHQSMLQMAAHAETSLFSVLQFGLAALIYRLSGCPDAVFGVNMAMRNNADLQNTIGFMVNTVLMRQHIDPLQSAAFNIRRIAADTLEAFEFSFYPFERILLDFDFPFQALSKIFLNMPNRNRGEMNTLRDFSASHLPDELRIGYFDLDFHLQEEKNGIVCHCEYKKHLFQPTDIETIHTAFISVLEALCGHPEAPIENLLKNN